MNLEVLISCMHQKNLKLAERTGIHSYALLINQCPDENALAARKGSQESARHQTSKAPLSNQDELEMTGSADGRIRMLRTSTRGLSRSRNLAIQHAIGEICLLCDDDEELDPSYEETILQAYERMPEADVICFRIKNQPSRLKQETQRLTKWTALRIASWQITFRRASIINRGILFDEDMGAGTGNGGGEEVKFLRDCIQAGLKAYYVPDSIGTVAQTESTWFQGFNRDFFYKRGVTNRYMLGLPISLAYALYYTIVKQKLYKSAVTPWQSFYYTVEGIMANDIEKQKKRRKKVGKS
ncbi:MAG TPA: glycosyl transferase family 2 [Oribacterium sp.]|nr:glycosyl transferase family 2 [Oribacterium sp.]